MQSINIKRVNDMAKLKQCLDRLKCDLNVANLNKKLLNTSSLDSSCISDRSDKQILD